jgi:hypothetical protein
VLGEVEDPRRLLHLGVDLFLWRLGQLQREGHVLAHAHVRVEGVILEHHRDVAILGCHLVDDPVPDPQLSLGDVLQPRDHPQRGRLPAPRRADEDHELSVADVEVHVLDSLEAVRKALRDTVENDLSHLLLSSI